jgi:hypothetical protein
MVHKRIRISVRTKPQTKSSKRSQQAIWLIVIAVILPLIFVRSGYSQTPPAIGPDSYHSDQKQIGVGILTGFVKTTLNGILSDTNAALRARGTSAHVDLVLPLTVASPFRLTTENTNRFNQYYVKLPMIVAFHLSIPGTSDRQISYPLDLNVSCDQWFTGNGAVKVLASVGPPSVEGGNLVEDALFIRDHINTMIRNYLPQIAALAQTIPNARCMTIGASPGNGTFDPFAFIAYDPPARRPIATGPALPRLEVTFLRLKRLQARGNGQVLYSPVENVMVDAFANYVERQSPYLTMREGDDVALNIPPVIFNAPLLKSLVIVVNLNQQNGSLGSTFAASALSDGSTGGQHVLQIPKSFTLPGRGGSKPLTVNVPGYELSYKITYVGSVIGR